jgi:hypothetical protein
MSKGKSAQKGTKTAEAEKRQSKKAQRRAEFEAMSESRRKQLRRQWIAAAIVVTVTAISLIISVLTPFFMR